MDLFYKRNRNIDGLEGACKVCRNKSTKNSRLKNKENYLLKKKENYQKNKEITKEGSRIRSEVWRKNNPEKYKTQLNIYQKLYRENNKEKRNTNHKTRKLIDPLYKIRCLISAAIQKQLKTNGYTKKSKTHEIIGCTYAEYINHIETQWSLPHNLDENGNVWMNWGNHGKYNGELNYGWDIDHRIPTSSAKTEDELLKLFHYSNLQPLCCYINRYIKKDRLDYHL